MTKRERIFIWLVAFQLNHIAQIYGLNGNNNVNRGPVVNLGPQQDIVATSLEQQPEDQAVSDWCDRNKQQGVKQECMKKLHQWCDTNRNDTTGKFALICKSNKTNTVGNDSHVLRVTEAPNPSTSIVRLSTVMKIPTTTSPGKAKGKKPVKASKASLKNLKVKLNDKQLKKYTQEKQASPTMDDPILFKRNRNLRVLPTELDVNDPENYFHGDVDLTEDQLKSLEADVDATNGRTKRKVGKPPSFHLWDSFPISYQFDESVPDATRNIIMKAIKLWEDNTCVRWQKDGLGENKVEFVNGDGCSSFVGKAGGVQEVSIRTPGCNRVGIASHEIGHSLGFFHEQSRPDQQSNVKINYPNIQVLRYNNFMPMETKDVNYYNMPYDYGSVMHYDALTKGFTYDEGQYSIITKDPLYQHTIGQRNGPSFVDFKQVNSAYCSNSCPQKIGCLHNGYENPNNCDECKCPAGLGGRLCETVQANPPQCGEVLLAKPIPQFFNSNNYPDNYTAGIQCNWLIIAPANSRVRLQFVETFSFPCYETCANNFIEVKLDGDFQRVGYRFCCSSYPQGQPFLSKTNKMVVMLRSYNDESDIGFKAKYWLEGGGDVQTLATTPSTVATLPSTTTTEMYTEPQGLFPRTTPTNPPGCLCEPWGPWDPCTQNCGGCGIVKRTRKCNMNYCYGTEKRHCNYDKCPPGNNFIWNNGEFHLLAFGCCFGLLSNSAGQCTGLAAAWNDFIQQAVSPH